MVQVVGYVERYDFFLFPVLVVYEGEDKASVGWGSVVHFKILFPAIDERVFLHLAPVGHEKVYALPLFVVGGIERTGALHHGEHVVHLERVGLVLDAHCAVLLDVALVHVAVSFGIGEPNFVYFVTLSLLGTFAVIEWHQFGGVVGVQRVAHHKVAVGLFGRLCNEIRLETRLSAIGGILGGERRCSHLEPNEFPVEEQIICKPFAAAECLVLQRGLPISV